MIIDADDFVTSVQELNYQVISNEARASSYDYFHYSQLRLIDFDVPEDTSLQSITLAKEAIKPSS